MTDGEKMLADLHCHTKLSDGSLGIEELITLAASTGVSTIGITDHDSMAATLRGKVIGERHGVQVIPGVELSTVDPATGRNVHLLCYLADHPDRLEGLCKRISLARRRAGQYMVLRVAKRFHLTPEFVMRSTSGSTNIYKQHIMHALMDAGISDAIFNDLFDELFIRPGENSVKVPIKYPDCHEVLAEIHEAGGIAVLAHPFEYDSIRVMEELTREGLDGVEVYHPSADAEKTEFLLGYAHKNGLLVTGGSDFHGLYNRRRVTVGSYGIEQPELDALLGYKTKKKRREAAAKKTAANG